MPLRMVRPLYRFECLSPRPPHANHNAFEGVSKPRAPSPSSPKSSAPRSSSQPAPVPKNVAFDLRSETSQLSSPGTRRHKRRGEVGESSRGYEAENDSESTFDGRDKRYPTHHPVSETESDPEKAARRRRHRRRPGRQSTTDGYDRNSDNDRPHDNDGYPSNRSSRHASSRSHRHHHHRPAGDGLSSPTGSDVTVDLPERFDKDGRKKPERGEDPVADALEDLLSGKGPGGKYFKKIFGGSGDDDEGGDSGGRKRRR